MLNKLPIIGWLLAFLGSVSLSIPFWVCWTICGIGEVYFYWLPDVFHVIPFWSCVGLFIVIGILKPALTPKLASVSQSNDNDNVK